MSLTTPGKIRELQIKLYRKAKNEPEFRLRQMGWEISAKFEFWPG